MAHLMEGVIAEEEHRRQIQISSAQGTLLVLEDLHTLLQLANLLLRTLDLAFVSPDEVLVGLYLPVLLLQLIQDVSFDGRQGAGSARRCEQAHHHQR